MKAGPPSYVDFRLINVEIFQGSNLVEFKVLPVSLIPGATVGGSEMVQQLAKQTKIALQSQLWKILLILYLVKQHLWGVGHPSWLSRTMLDQTSRRKITSQSIVNVNC